MRITAAKLLEKLELLDDRILNVWLQDEPPLNDEERWDIFVTLLETRVEVLKTLKDAGVKLAPEVCVPKWLERLSSSRTELRRRELRAFEEERQTRRQISKFEAVAELSTRGAPAEEA